MNGIAIQLSASALALGLMGSAVGVHYFNVKKATEIVEYDELQENLSYVSYEVSDSQGFLAETEIPDFRDTPSIEESKEQVHLKLLETMVVRLEKLNNENESLRKETVELREQVAETNRDLSQLQFRVDSHSESFRPLRVSEENTFQKALPAHPVLPPKNW